jgi:hypothetical protein
MRAEQLVAASAGLARCAVRGERLGLETTKEVG